MKLKKEAVFAFIAVLATVASAANIVLMGDSTLAPRTDNSRYGSWGDALKPALADGNSVLNFAISGRTVRTFKPTWEKNFGKVVAGDFVIIQFGINDASQKKLVEEDEFKKTLTEWVDAVLAKGATPILCSPVANAGWSKDAKPDSKFRLTSSRRKYGDFAKAVAEAKGVAYVDMTALTAGELSKVGKDAAHAMYVGDSTKDGKPIFDTCHPSKSGAKRFAELFVADVKARKLPVAKLFKSGKEANDD